ncbi:hypothetical protein MS2017_1213 [Bathymodiolus thermophilus thioautotrophic gill symbiont]|uniref:Uncharacterized protein n=1 Tax=Bathymodiolus thermophilus thioautotrophic gill symbiont TaxID=2360 RepID=A0A3G3IMA2_9GAMM|nr:hypothetical protein [Bathymodiolus thermophilus thioautotrophic gill symbiont]AYQ56911.1 hypothetical protein MS2017_1213 [Bathymodiolus thermophilus thioautotrophic gill symbiont]
MNTLHYITTASHRNLATPRLNSSQLVSYFSTLITCLVNRGFLAFIAFITIVEKKYSIFKTISSTLPSITPLYRKIFPYTAKLVTLTPKKIKHLSLIIKAFLSFQATKVISVGNKKYNNFSNKLETINQYLAITLIHHYLETTQKNNH